MTQTHELKIWPEYYNAILDGRKKFELRKADRPYKVGDTLLLKEYDPLWEKYTERECLVSITYILEGQHAIPGYCLMSIELEDYQHQMRNKMTTQSWIARYIPTAYKECPICVSVGNIDHYISVEDAYRLKHTITMAIDDLKEASQNREEDVNEK